MIERHAGGRKTQSKAPLQGGPIEIHVDDQLAAMTAAMQGAFARADTFGPANDEYGHARAREFDNAVALAKTTAKLLLAVGKLRGRFQHAITVQRLPGNDAIAANDPEEPVERAGDEEPLFTHEELETLSNPEIRRQIPIRKAERAAARAGGVFQPAAAVPEAAGA